MSHLMYGKAANLLRMFVFKVATPHISNDSLQYLIDPEWVSRLKDLSRPTPDIYLLANLNDYFYH